MRDVTRHALGAGLNVAYLRAHMPIYVRMNEPFYSMRVVWRGMASCHDALWRACARYPRGNYFANL